MNTYQKRRKKHHRKPLYLLLGFLLVFGLFIYLLIWPSVLTEAIDELQQSVNAEDVRITWEKHKADLGNEEAYVTALRDKLASFNLSPSALDTCLKWLPKPQTSLNVIIVPDLSGRINDQLNNPGQVTNDTILLNQIWQSFEAATRLKINTDDRLLVDVTGGNQALGQFRSIANELVFDLSGFKDKSHKLYFQQKQGQFREKVARLYQMAGKNPQGADYWTYFNHDLKRNIRMPNLYADYRNLLIILTDGYLEAQTNQATGTALYTGTYPQRLGVFNRLKTGQTLDNAVSAIAPIMDCSEHFPSLEVLVLEVHARHGKSPQEPKDPGTARDFDILKKIWANWFTRLEIKNASTDFFNERLNATDLSRQKIRDFIEKD